MKAFTPVRPQDSSSSSSQLSLHYLSKHSLNIARCRMEEEDLFCLQYDMNDCYSRLKRLVPTIPQDKKVSKVEILQHVIDYILDLQLALETHPSLHKQAQPQRTGTCPPPASNPSRTPLTVLNTDHHEVPPPRARLQSAQDVNSQKAGGLSFMPLRHKHCIGVQAAQSRSKASKASPGTHTQLEAQSQGGFQNRWEELNPNKITIHITIYLVPITGNHQASLLFPYFKFL
ncbi:hypothetical protein LDENG_00068300 [Lucifuga dentata]|nr:hypothetical protein LDENG_00068300 [Lucifuga dentata]